MASQKTVLSSAGDAVPQSSSPTGLSWPIASPSDAAATHRSDAIEESDDIQYLLENPHRSPPQTVQSHSPALPTYASLQQRSSLESRSLSFPSEYTHTSVQVSLTSSTVKDNTIQPNTPPFICNHHINLTGRVSSCDGHHPPQINMREMGHAFVKELRPQLVQEDRNLSRVMFSSKAFAVVQLDTVLSKMRSVWSTQQMDWKYKLDFTSEANVAAWLNQIGKAFAQETGSRLRRLWGADSCTVPLSGASADVPFKAKPDIILVDYNAKRTIPTPTWGTICAFGEITSQETFHSEMRRGLYTKTSIMFTTQESRRFIPSLAFYGKTDMKMRLFMFDREGMIYEDVPMKTVDDALTLLRIVAGFMCGDPVMLGYDPTVTLNDIGEVDTIMVQGEKTKATYRIKQKVHVATGLVGRCTRVWHGVDVDDPSKQVIIKDAWPHTQKANTEALILNRLHGVKGAPNILTAVTVMAARYQGGTVYPDSTQTFRSRFKLETVHARKHRRLVMTSVGEKIYHFRALSELIGAFRDVIKGE